VVEGRTVVVGSSIVVVALAAVLVGRRVVGEVDGVGLVSAADSAVLFSTELPELPQPAAHERDCYQRNRNSTRQTMAHLGTVIPSRSAVDSIRSST